MIKDYYIFPCVFIYEEEGISIFFPDLDGCVTFGDSEENAFENAKEALELHLFGMEQDNEDIPQPSCLKDILLESNEKAIFVEAFMPVVRAKMLRKSIKKTLTIPAWLNLEAERRNVNFSLILQKALKEYLQIDA